MPERPIFEILILAHASNPRQSVLRITTPHCRADLLTHIKNGSNGKDPTVELIIPQKNDSIMVQWASSIHLRRIAQQASLLHSEKQISRITAYQIGRY
ncbi:hypothetical protein ACT691_03345 [Vibrio metschnikovii]